MACHGKLSENHGLTENGIAIIAILMGKMMINHQTCGVPYFQTNPHICDHHCHMKLDSGYGLISPDVKLQDVMYIDVPHTQ